MADPSTNYGWDIPDVSGDTGNWGTILNVILADIDDKLFTADAVADAALPLAGGVMTGHLDIKTSQATGAQISGGSGGTKTIDLSAANYYRMTTAITGGAVVLDITNKQSSSPDFEAVIIQLKNAGAASSITFKVAGAARTVLWQDGASPTWTASGDDVIVLFTWNGWAASSVVGVVAVQDPS